MNYLLFISAVVEPIFYKLVYMSIVASIIGIVIFAVTRIFKNKFSPKWVSRIWLLFIFCLIVPIQFKSPFSIYNALPEDLGITFKNVNIAQDSFWMQSQLEGIDEIFNTYLNGELNAEKITEQEAEEITKNFEEDYNDYSKTYSNKKLINFLPLIWILIVLVLAVLYIIIYFSFVTKLKKSYKYDERLNRILDKCKNEMNIKRKIRIFYQDAIDMPSIFGLFKIKILINSDSEKLTDKELSYIVKHELAHYKRKDNWLNFLISILRCIYIFNPIVFFCLRKVKKDLELATDELAMKSSSTEEQQEYLKTLVILSENKPAKFLVQTLCLSDEKKNLERRIDSLKLFDKFKKNSKRIAIVSIAFVAILTVTCFTRNEEYMKKEDIEKFLSTKEDYDFSNYYIKEIVKLRDGTIDYISETYKYGNKVKVVRKYTEDNGVPTTITNYYNVADKNFEIIEDEFGKKEIKYSNNEFYADIENQNANLKESLKNYSSMDKYIYEGIQNIDGEDCFVLRAEGLHLSNFNEKLKLEIRPFIEELYISTSTGLIKKIVTDYKVFLIDAYAYSQYSYKFGNIKDEDFIIPDLSEYKDTTTDFYTKTIDFYELKDKILQNSQNSEEALNDFTMLENLPDGKWAYSYSDKYYLLNDEYVFDFIFDSYSNDEYYKLTVRQNDQKLLKLETGKLNENGELIVNTIEY